MILYESTRGDKKLYNFSQTILKGIADDGGLFVPTRIPQFTVDQLKTLVHKSYQERAYFIFKLFETDFSDETLKDIIYKAYSTNFDVLQIAPVIKLKDNQYILELWHGPTSAFKDLALQIMPHFFSEALKSDNQKRRKKGEKPLCYLILVATSGDTGKAALEGYKDKEGVSIIVFFPDKRVSKFQELSMTTQEGNNVEVYAMSGNFDDTQRCVKETFADNDFNKLLLDKYQTVLSSANSINWGRLIPQIVYHVNSYLELADQGTISLEETMDVAVPTGNFGNILAAFYAKKMGLPIRRLICASNANKVLTEVLQTGSYSVQKRTLIKTPSPSMDIIIASNFERLLYELTQDSKKVCEWMRELKETKQFSVNEKTKQLFQKLFYADWVSNDDCLLTIKKIYEETHYLMDTHTAVVQAVVERYQKDKQSETPILICSTAHWTKFTADVYKALSGTPVNEINDLKLRGLDEFDIFNKLFQLVPDSTRIPQNISNLKNKKIRHNVKCKPDRESVEKVIIKSINN